jgi:hypothetical protein
VQLCALRPRCGAESAEKMCFRYRVGCQNSLGPIRGLTDVLHLGVGAFTHASSLSGDGARFCRLTIHL